jgi:hypothetical protein
MTRRHRIQSLLFLWSRREWGLRPVPGWKGFELLMRPSPQEVAGNGIHASNFPCLSDLAASIFLLTKDGYGPNNEVLLGDSSSLAIFVRLFGGSCKCCILCTALGKQSLDPGLRERFRQRQKMDNSRCWWRRQRVTLL